jgi:RNA polymerase sigma-70 factor (ECF subfamily)
MVIIRTVMIKLRQWKNFRLYLTVEPVEYAEVLILYYYRRFSYEEIASETDTPIGTVKSRLNRAKDALISRVKAEGINLEEMKILKTISEWPSIRFL